MSAPPTQERETGLLGRGAPVPADELLNVPLFKGVSKKLLEDNLGAVVLRDIRKGEMICRQGEYGSTAFYILSGSCEVFINTPIAHVNTAPEATGFMGLMKKMASVLGGRKDSKEAAPTPEFVRIDAPVDLPWGEFRATIGAGSLFGEMTCLNYYPRSATVVAREDCVVFEMLRNILDLIYKSEPQTKWRKEKAAFLKKSPGQKYEVPRPQDGPIGQTYRERSLKNHLASFPLFKKLSPEFLEQLRTNADIVTFEPGEIIFNQDDLADDFYIVRLGFVKVSQTWPGGDVVLKYLSRGQYFGEIALLAKAEGREANRTATCTAIDHVEAVAISGDDFREMIAKFPEIAADLRTEAQRRLKQDARTHTQTRSTELGEYLERGLMQAQSLLVLDLDKCTRCDECVRACADSHDGVTRLVRDGLRFDRFLVATSCRSCLDPVCMIGCPVGSIVRIETREIRIEDWCIGCEQCANNCPYGNINMHPFEVDAGSKLFAKQSPVREVRVKLNPLPAGIDVTTLPEGMSYDFGNRALVFAGVPNERNKAKLFEYNDDARYRAAVEQLFALMQTRVPLNVLPNDFKPDKRLAPYISFDEKSKSLVFLGVIAADDKVEYLSFSSDTQYKQAVEQAAKLSISQKAVVKKATTCDLCESLRGPGNDNYTPNCVYACPHEAALRIVPQEFFEPVIAGKN